MQTEKTSLSKNNLFAYALLMLAGSMNAYASCIYGAVAGAHTGDLTKMSSNLANGKWDSALNNALMILFCILGVFLTEVLKHNFKGKGDWRKLPILYLATGYLAISFATENTPQKLMCYICSLFCGFMLNLFRDCAAGAFNSTIQTGNMRTLAQYLYEAMDPKCKTDWKRFLQFFGLIIFYAIGAVLITFACNAMAHKASLFISIGYVAIFLWLNHSEK